MTITLLFIEYNSNKVAVFGVALLDKEKGESHLAAMPYEIILHNKIAIILHGRYKLALHWPELTMETFMKIMSTPEEIENTLKDLCE